MTAIPVASPHCRHTVTDGVYTIELQRPEQRNALTPGMYEEVRLAVLRAHGMRDVDAVVIAGSQGTFAAGGDLNHFLSLLSLESGSFRVEFGQSFDLPLPFRAILDCPKPVIAAVDGPCIAGGLLLACAADVVIATDRAIFALPEGRVGLADGVAPVLLPAVFGLSRARYLMLTGRSIDARQAERWGLVSEVVSPAELPAAVASLTATLRLSSPEAKATYKRIAVAQLAHMSNTVIADVADSDDGREGLTAFAEKRAPRWATPARPGPDLP